MTLLQDRLEKPWSFSGLATMVRIVLMYYINLNTFFENPDRDLKKLIAEAAKSPPPVNQIFREMGLSMNKN